MGKAVCLSIVGRASSFVWVKAFPVTRLSCRGLSTSSPHQKLPYVLWPRPDGVTTPLPQFQDRDLEVSSQVHNSRPSRTPPVSAPSPSPASVANPYVSVPPPPQASFVRPSRFCSFSRPGSAARRPSSQARTVPLRSRSPPGHPLSLSLSGQSSCPPPSHPRARLFCPVPSCPDHSLTSHGWAIFGSMRPHIDAHLAGQLVGDIPMDWLRGQGFSTCEVCQRVLSLRFNGRCPSCFRTFSSLTRRGLGCDSPTG